MSLITELMGLEVLELSLEQVKEKINRLPPALKEKRAYLLKDYAKIKNITLTENDFLDVNS